MLLIWCFLYLDAKVHGAISEGHLFDGDKSNNELQTYNDNDIDIDKRTKALDWKFNFAMAAVCYLRTCVSESLAMHLLPNAIFLAERLVAADPAAVRTSAALRPARLCWESP